MKKRRVRFFVELDLDPVPGFNHEPQDYSDRLRWRLEHEIAWYRPTVGPALLIGEPDPDPIADKSPKRK